MTKALKLKRYLILVMDNSHQLRRTNLGPFSTLEEAEAFAQANIAVGVLWMVAQDKRTPEKEGAR